MMKLSDEHRAVVTLFDIQGLSHSEISKIMNCKEETVRSRLFYAHKQLQKYLKELLIKPWTIDQDFSAELRNLLAQKSTGSAAGHPESSSSLIELHRRQRSPNSLSRQSLLGRSRCRLDEGEKRTGFELGSMRFPTPPLLLRIAILRLLLVFPSRSHVTKVDGQSKLDLQHMLGARAPPSPWSPALSPPRRPFPPKLSDSPNFAA